MAENDDLASSPDVDYSEEEDVDLSFDDAESVERYQFRPSIADERKVGFFSLDRATQTEESEIVHLKEMTEVIQRLLKEAAEMKRNINLTKQIMTADFEAKLQNKSIELYCRINEKVKELEKIHEDRTSTVRRAFKQQFADAIARLHSYYGKYVEERLGKDASTVHGESARLEAKCREMTSTIQRNESIIHMLKSQVEQYQRQLDEANRAVRTAELAAQASGPEPEPVEIKSRASRSESVIAEIDGLKDEINTLEQRCARTEDKVEEKEALNDKLTGQVQDLMDHLEREKVMVSQLRHEREELLNESAHDKASGQRMMESQLVSLQREMEEKVRLATETALSDSKDEAAKLLQMEQAKIARLLEEKAALEKRLSKALNKAGEKSKEAIDLEKVKRSEIKLVTEVTRLKKETEKVHKAWEKKFTILQQSLHALKDESYLRQTLQRQAAQLHQASVSYAYDSPMGISPNKTMPPGQNFKRPLPDIGGKGRKSPDAISYTVSVASGRNTAVFEPFDELENQVMSDGELELPPEFLPLPPPPSKNPQELAEEERAASRSHIVILPTAEVQ